MEIGLAAERVREDRISKLDDAVLGHVLSFLPSKQAARAAVLSSRWRDAFAGVHTVSLEEPEGGLPAYDHGRRPRESDEYHDVWLDPPSSFGPAITAAIVARHRSPATTPPLRAFRVALHDYKCRDSIAVDQWVSYALKQAGPELELDLRLKHLPICCRGGGDAAEINVLFLYTVPRGLFSCSALRTLRIGPCRLSPPPAISLPSLQELLLTRVSDAEEVVQRLISACPRLADLTLECCDTVTALSLFDTVGAATSQRLFFFNLTLSQPPLCLSQLTRIHTAKEKHNPLRVFLLGHINATLFAGALTALIFINSIHLFIHVLT
jgi:hypothetical protein